MPVKISSLLLIIVMAGSMACQTGESNNRNVYPEYKTPVVQEGGIERDASHLQYTRHARCRMDCRHISTTEVQDILLHGSVNTRKSDLKDKPCPTYALEGYTLSDHQHVRIIFAQCDHTVKVVTCIDLDHDFTCNCR